MNAITICNTTVCQLGGLYSLNDLHRASGGKENYQPAFFLRNDQTQKLIAELSNSANSQNYIPVKVTRGKHGGTYVCRELVIAYAAWISAAFHLKVIRVFLEQATPHHTGLPLHITTEQQGILFNLMANRFPDGRDRPYSWARFNNHYKINSYKNLPVEKFADACDYIDKLPTKVTALPAPKKYHYPRKLLEQPYFTAPKLPAGLDINMLGDSRNFSSPLMALLNDLRTDGHEIDAAWDEFIAMREGIQKFSDFLKNLQIDALKTWVAEASTSLRKQ